MGRICVLVLAGLSAAGWPAPPARAQLDGESLEACARIADEGARLQCYDRAAGQSGDRPGDVEAPVSDAGPEGSPTADSQASASMPAEAPVVEVETEDLPADARERRSRLWRQRDEDQQAFSVVVVQRVENLSGLSVFVSEDGTVFDQVSPRKSRYPEPPFAASLDPASRGSYWLTTDTGARAVRVTRRD